MFSWLKKLRFPKKEQSPSPRQVVSVGDISKVEIPSSLPYAGALRRIQKEATGTGVSFDVSNFYSESAIELHNFTSSLTYRFINSGEKKAIAYIIEDRDIYSCDYKEIDYQGNLLFTFSEALVGKKDKTPEEVEFIRRANSILGKYKHCMSGL